MVNQHDIDEKSDAERDHESFLLFRKPYAYAALGRAASQKGGSPELFDLYTAIHSDTMTSHAEWDNILPLAAGEEGTETDYLLKPLADLPLSIVVTSRNDDHVERMHERTQAFIDGIFFLAEKLGCKTELIIVEWNPPKDRSSMAEAFRFPATHEYVSCRVMTVPEYVHDRYDWAQSLPLYQMIAKNAGMRRARGKFIAVTNIDILFSEELFQQMVNPSLTKGCLYRSDRWDVDRKILDQQNVGDMIGSARELHFQTNYWQGLYQRGETPATLSADQLSDIRNHSKTSLTLLHTEACGDFQMLHRDDWRLLRGYSELDAYSFHIDSLFSVSCFHAGLQEEVLSGPHFHIDHTLGVKVESDTYEINEKKIIKHLGLQHLWILDRLQHDAQDFFLMNDETWGLGADSLPDQLVTQAHWEETETQVYSPISKPSKSSLLALGDLEKSWRPSFRRFMADVWLSTSTYVQKKYKGRPVFVWGAGKRGITTASALERHGLVIEGLIHGGPKAPKSDIFQVRGARTFLEGGPSSAFVIIASIYADEIRVELEANDWREGEDYIVGI